METEHALIDLFAENIICNKFQEKSPSFMTIAWISSKFSTIEISATTPPSPPPPV